MKTTLEEILAFRHPGVENRFCLFFKKTPEEAKETFSDLMRFFWASEKHEQDKMISNSSDLDFVFIMDEAMRPIDDIWHIFLLYTKDYMDFCDQYFGQYIHHLPDIVPNMEQDTQKFEENLEKFINYNYDLLGQQTIERWFGEVS